MSNQRSDFKPEPKQALLQRAEKIFRERFGAAPEALSFAPGRVEVLGNHTDYNGGFVMAVALEQGIAAAAGRSKSAGEVEIFSERMSASARFSLKNIAHDPQCR
jgi:galactokinase